MRNSSLARTGWRTRSGWGVAVGVWSRSSTPPRSGHGAVLVAPDKFKGSLAAVKVAAAVAAGLIRADPSLNIDLCPVADGGDGFLDSIAAAGFQRVPVHSVGPTGRSCMSAFAAKDGVAVVESADVLAVHRLPNRTKAPLEASSAGLGHVMRAALESGCHTLVVGLGGSASTDGGSGMLTALGVRLLDAAGQDLEPGGAALLRLDRIDLSLVHPRMREVRLLMACDVDNPLLGVTGAASVYGPQKGADPANVELLERALARWAALLGNATGTSMAPRPGAGAAGGIGFAGMSLGGESRPGIDLVLNLVGFQSRLANADLVITGEGSLDAQTLFGKAPAGVAAAASQEGVPVVAVAGQINLSDVELKEVGFHAWYALTDLDADVQRCLLDAPALLETLGMQIVLDRRELRRRWEPL